MIRNFKWFFGTLAIMMAMGNSVKADPIDVPYCVSAVRDMSIPLDEYFATCFPGSLGADDRGGILGTGGTVWSNAALSSTYTVAQMIALGVPQWTDAEIMAHFATSRSDRYLEQSTVPGYPRRISWLFPDNGCFARAEQVIGMETDPARKPFKLWALDTSGMNQLEVITDNHPSGQVNWTWHVVPLVLNSANQPIVFDAALNPCGPLFWEDWLALMVGGNASLFDDTASPFRVVVSDYNAYVPGHEIFDQSPGHADHLADSYVELEDDSDPWYRFLYEEWERQVTDLSRDSEEMFGDDPVWLDSCPIICIDNSWCDDGNPCTDDVCNLSTYTCEYFDLEHLYEAESDMYQSTGGPYSTDGWNIWSDGYVSFSHTFGPGDTEITVRAAGSYAGGAWPMMRLDVDGGAPPIWVEVNSTSWQDYVFTVNVPPGSHEVRINFINDYYNPPADRNLYVDKAIVECNPLAPPDEAINLGPIHTQTVYPVDGTQDLVIDQLGGLEWASKIVVGFADVGGGLISGITVSVDSGPPTTLWGYWDTIEIPFSGQTRIDLTVVAPPPARNLRTQWWAEP